VWERRGEWRIMEDRRGEVRKWTDVPLQGHSVFVNGSYNPQLPVDAQLGITLYRLGHNGNTASIEVIAQWAGVCAGTVVNSMCQVMIAFLALHDAAICWPLEEEKEEAKEWVECKRITRNLDTRHISS
jgi:hypothetical protein